MITVDETMMEAVEALGEEVERLWKKEKYAKEAFSRIAFETLQKNKIHTYFSMEEFLQWLRKTKDLPEQHSLYNGFGKPPITLYRNDSLNFLIDIYFWVTPEVAIHSHGFRGAFTTLEGKSVQCRYKFSIRENFKNQILIGDLLLKEATFLKKGEVREIYSGQEFIHQVWHISFPTISLVIRTAKQDVLQYTYLNPHLAFQDRPYTPLESKQMDTLLMLHRVHSPQEEHFLEELLQTAEPLVGLMHLKRYFEETHDLNRVKILTRIPKHRKWAPYLLECFRRTGETWVSWEGIQDEGERFFFALLNSFDKRDDILRFIKTYDPGKPALTAARGWLKKLVENKRLRFQLNETAQDILGLLLKGYGEKEICQKLSTRYEVENSEAFRKEISSFCDQLRSLELLKALMPHSLSGKKMQDD